MNKDKLKQEILKVYRRLQELIPVAYCADLPLPVWSALLIDLQSFIKTFHPLLLHLGAIDEVRACREDIEYALSGMRLAFKQAQLAENDAFLSKYEALLVSDTDTEPDTEPDTESV